MVDMLKRVGELVRCDGVLIIGCLSCGHHSVMRAVDVLYRVSQDRYIDSLRFRCGQCKRRDTLARSYIPVTRQALETVINAELDF